MTANPRFALLLLRYAQYDQTTLILAGLALGAVLVGWALTSSGSRKFDRLLSQGYLAFLAVVYILIMAGILITI